MPETIEIGPQYYGFPNVGFGGYVAGRLAAFVGEAAEVTLRSPPPLERPMTVEDHGEGRFRLLDGDVLVAQAIASLPEVQIPAPPVSLEEASLASERFPGWRAHPFPMCFTCGIERAEGQGLRIFLGPLEDREGAAGAWVPHPAFAAGDGLVRPEFVWAALDCPTYWGMFPDGRGPNSEDGTLLGLTTGRIHTQVLGPVAVGERYVVQGWPLSMDGRKYIGGAAVFDEDGEPRAVSLATWLPLPPEAMARLRGA